MYPFYSLIVGNSLDRGLFSPDVFDMTITSPPYNVGKNYKNGASDYLSVDEYLSFTRRWLSNVYYWSKDGGRLAINVPLATSVGGRLPLASLVHWVARDVGWNFHGMITWQITNVTRRTAWGSFMQASAPYVNNPNEVISIWYKGDTYKIPCSKENTTINKDEFISWTTGLWTFPGQPKKAVGGHPAPFPVELPRRLIRLFTCRNAVVFDPFVGSGSTVVAAKEQGRSGVGVDLNIEFIKFAKQRLK